MPKSESLLLAPDSLDTPGTVGSPATAPALRALSLRRNFSWALVGNVVFAVCQWAVLAALAKVIGEPSAVGRFALALAITTPVYMLARLQLRGIQATDAQQLYQFGHYLGLRLIATSVALIGAAAVVVAVGYEKMAAAVILAVAVGKAFDSITDVTMGLPQRHERLDRVARARVLSGIASLLGLLLAVWITRDVFWAAVGWAAGHGLTASTCRWWIGNDVLGEAVPVRNSPDGGHRSALAPIWDFRAIAGLAKLAFPLGVVMMLVSLKLNAPRYFIESMLDEETLGIFAAMAYLMTAGHFVAIALGQSASPRLAKLHARGESGAFWTLLGKLLGLAACGGILGTLLAAALGRPLLAILYAPEYATHLQVFVCLAAVAGVQFAVSFFGEAMTAVRSFRAQVPLLLVVVAVTMAGCAVLIPHYGMMGAVAASGIGETAQLFGSAYVVYRAVQERRRRFG